MDGTKLVHSASISLKDDELAFTRKTSLSEGTQSTRRNLDSTEKRTQPDLIKIKPAQNARISSADSYFEALQGDQRRSSQETTPRSLQRMTRQSAGTSSLSLDVRRACSQRASTPQSQSKQAELLVPDSCFDYQSCTTVELSDPNHDDKQVDVASIMKDLTLVEPSLLCTGKADMLIKRSSGAQRTTPANSTPSGQEKSDHTNSQKSMTSPPNKSHAPLPVLRHGFSKDGFNDGDDEKAPGRNNSGGHGQDLSQNKEKSNLACPYWIKCPEKHRKCCVCDLKGFAAVKQHLERVHKRPSLYCERCFAVFQVQSERDSHLRQSIRCIALEDPFLEKMPPDSWGIIKKKSYKHDDDETKWRHTFETLFPNEPQPPSVLREANVDHNIRRYMPNFFKMLSQDTLKLVAIELANNNNAFPVPSFGPCALELSIMAKDIIVEFDYNVATFATATSRADYLRALGVHETQQR